MGKLSHAYHKHVDCCLAASVWIFKIPFEAPNSTPKTILWILLVSGQVAIQKVDARLCHILEI